jgi:hypothetical protein
MPFTKYANLDFDQVKTQIKDYLRANSEFTDFDFEGSNFSVLIDTLAYNTYITAFNSNLAINESFLDSATLRENVVSLARNIGYVPRSQTSAIAKVSFSVKFTGESTTLTLKAGLVAVGKVANSAYVFSIPEDITTTSPLDTPGTGTNFGPRTAVFSDIDLHQGSFAKKSFNVDGSLDQRFILPNSFIDTGTLIVKVKGPSDTTSGTEYTQFNNIVGINDNSDVYFIQEIKDEQYELLFGDGILGKKLESGSVITATYIIGNGSESNGVSEFSYSGTIHNSLGQNVVPTDTISITTNQKASGGAAIESLESIKYFAPRVYSSQHRAVTARDYETIVKEIFPQSESVSVTGGEELNPPRFGEVIIAIKPKNEFFVSDFNKEFILNRLKQYSLAGIKQSIVDLEVLSVEIDVFAYFNSSKVNNVIDLKTTVTQAVSDFADSEDLNNFGGRFKYSQLLQKIDNSSSAITSNITKVTLRRDLQCKLNQSAQYEICYGNKFNVRPQGRNIKSSGFRISGIEDTLYITDIPNVVNNNVAITDNLQAGEEVFGRRPSTNLAIKTGNLQFISIDSSNNVKVVVESAGTVDYEHGEIILFTTNIVSTAVNGGIIEIQAFPESNDVIGLKNIFVELSTDKSTINMLKDTISSGEEISGVGFPVTSSYSNGSYIRVK